MPVVKHNTLIETSYKLNSREQFFIIFLIAQINRNDLEFKEYRMTYKEIYRILNFDGKHRIANREEVFQMMRNLNQEPIVYERGPIIGETVWLQHMEFNSKTDEFTFKLSEKLGEYLFQLKEHFTIYNFGNIIHLSSSSVRLYELLKRHEYSKECVLTVESIKFYLGAPQKYPKFYDFKRYILIPAQKEIQKYTDIRFTFEPHDKIGKSIVSLKIKIYKNKPSANPDLTRLIDVIEGREEAVKTGTEYIETPKPKPNLRPNINPVVQSGLYEMSKSQLKAFEFLDSKGVNQQFIIVNILTHSNLHFEVVKGFEDLYFQQLWTYFDARSKAIKRGGAFVSWWRNGKLTKPNLQAQMIELLIQKQKSLPKDEWDLRKKAATMSHEAFDKWLKEQEAETQTQETPQVQTQETNPTLKTPQMEPTLVSETARAGEAVPISSLINKVKL